MANLTETTSTATSPCGDASTAKPADRCPACPHERIIEAYHAILPTCPRVREWGDMRRKRLALLWRERVALGKFATVEDGVAYFERYFRKVAASQFLTGQAPTSRDRGPFVADLEWLVHSGNFVKVIEGRYDR